ncbi:LysR family transcriptional regulator [Galactobacter valiniphilus]|uniref:LysR family transcriptional regulator n=1 Tax=Galactobacter valiniphilus TaxID=2676122 RepID=UPI0037368175
MRTLDIAALRSLTAVSSFAGVARAAEVLHVSQPTVSGHLRRLEAELGTPLTHRLGRNIAFTSAGEELVRRAHRLLALHDDAVDALLGRAGDELVVAASDLAAAPLVRVAAAALQERFPGRPVRFRFHRSERLRAIVQEGAADVVLAFTDLGTGSVTLGHAELGWFRADSDVPVPEDRLVLFTRPCSLREAIEDAVEGLGVSVAREALDLTGVLSAVREGVGLTALPLGHRTEVGLRRIEGPAPLPTLRLSALVSPRLGPAAKPVLEALRAETARVQPGA